MFKDIKLSHKKANKINSKTEGVRVMMLFYWWLWLRIYNRFDGCCLSKIGTGWLLLRIFNLLRLIWLNAAAAAESWWPLVRSSLNYYSFVRTAIMVHVLKTTFRRSVSSHNGTGIFSLKTNVFNASVFKLPLLSSLVLWNFFKFLLIFS